jgi:hypothetical protein
MTKMIKKLLNGDIPIELIKQEKIMTVYHMTDGLGLNYLLESEHRKDNPICAFSKSGGSKYLWEGPTAKATYLVKLKGKSLFHYHGDLWTDRVGRTRYINLINLNNSIKEDLSLLIKRLRTTVFDLIKPNIPTTRWRNIEESINDTSKSMSYITIRDIYIDFDQELILSAVKEQLDKLDFVNLLALTNPFDVSYDEVILEDYQIVDIYSTGVIEIDYPHKSSKVITFEEYSKITG